MAVLNLRELQDRWKQLTEKVSRNSKIAGEILSLRQLLSDCMESGAIVRTKIDRAKLQWLAREIADTIFRESDEYPDVIIAPPTVLFGIPHHRNPCFTGRARELNDLRFGFTKDNASGVPAVQAITGLGGIGKTQTAVEYAYRYREEYKAVLWASAETYESLVRDFMDMAVLLVLPERHAQSHHEVVCAVRRWLEHNDGWLWVVDGADDPELMKEFLPRDVRGHVLLTSRAQVLDILGVREPVVLQELSPEEALRFLLARTARYDDDVDERKAASRIAELLGALPLALEQAAAYIKAKGTRFQDYLTGYEKRELELLDKERSMTGDYHRSVASTWRWNVQEVENASSAAAGLLRFSAFLSADKIPDELISIGAPELGTHVYHVLADVGEDPLRLDEALEPLTHYSLIRRDRKARTYEVHRLVQAVIKEGMDDAEKREWAERTVRAVNRAFPEVTTFLWAEEKTRRRCDRLLSHAQACMRLIDTWNLRSLEAARLASNAGLYLQRRKRLPEAKALMKQALEIRREMLQAGDPTIAESLNNLADLYCDEVNYAEAEPLYESALAMRQSSMGPEGLDVAETLNNLGALYRKQGRYAEAETSFGRALDIFRKALGEGDLKLAVSLNNLAVLYYNQDKYGEAEALYQESLAIREKALGQDHPDVARNLNNLALLYYSQGRIGEAEGLARRSLEIRERVLGARHLDTENSLDALVAIYYTQGRYSQAEAYSRRLLSGREEALGPERASLAKNLYNMAEVLLAQAKYGEAERYYQRSLEVGEKAFGAKDPLVADNLLGLGEICRVRGDYGEAERLYSKVRTIAENTLGLEHLTVAISLNNLAELYSSQGKYPEAERLARQSLQIREKIWGSEHPRVANAINTLAGVCRAQGKHAEAEELAQRSLEIREKALGGEHPDVAKSLNTLAEIYRAEGKDAEAEQSAQRSLEIREKALGEEHPDVARSLNTLAEVYRAQGKDAEAEQSAQRSRAIGEKMVRDAKLTSLAPDPSR